MKTLIAIFFLCVSSFAVASPEKCNHDFEVFKETALRLIPASMQVEIVNAKLLISDTRYVLDSREYIKVPCDADDSTNSAMIAREISRSAMRSMNDNTTDKNVDFFAAELVVKSEYDPWAYLQIMDDFCRAGESYACAREDAWLDFINQ